MWKLFNPRLLFFGRTPIKRVPVVGGEAVDMYKLYSQVTEMGGFSKVIFLQVYCYHVIFVISVYILPCRLYYLTVSCISKRLHLYVYIACVCVCVVSSMPCCLFSNRLQRISNGMKLHSCFIKNMMCWMLVISSSSTTLGTTVIVIMAYLYVFHTSPGHCILFSADNS